MGTTAGNTASKKTTSNAQVRVRSLRFRRQRTGKGTTSRADARQTPAHKTILQNEAVFEALYDWQDAVQKSLEVTDLVDNAEVETPELLEQQAKADKEANVAFLCLSALIEQHR